MDAHPAWGLQEGEAGPSGTGDLGSADMGAAVQGAHIPAVLGLCGSFSPGAPRAHAPGGAGALGVREQALRGCGLWCHAWKVRDGLPLLRPLDPADVRLWREAHSPGQCEGRPRSQQAGLGMVQRTFDSGNLVNCIQGQAWVGTSDKSFGNPVREEVGSISFHEDSLQWDLFQSFSELLSRNLSQDSCETHKQVGKIFFRKYSTSLSASRQ